MQKSNQYILFAGLFAGIISMLYFFSLVVHLPFVITAIICAVAGFGLFRYIRGLFLTDALPELSKWALPVLIAGVFLIALKANELATKYGDWDAWAMWNFHARYLVDPQNWTNLVANFRNAHPDYPLLLPGCEAFFLRLFNGHFALMMPYIIAMFFTLAIPITIYLETAGKNIVVAAFVLLFFWQDAYFLSRGVSQYADTPLAWFFLCLFICINNAENKKAIAVMAFLLGCCMWTKNEGFILSAVFILFYARTLFARKNIMYFLSGIVLPMVSLLIFKLHYAPPNDIVSGQGADTLHQITQLNRYHVIYDHLKDNLKQNFNYVQIGVLLYAIQCIVEKKGPDKQMILILTCLALYMATYVITVQDLEWHLNTSQDRLIHQLMPAMIYVLAMRFARIRFSLPQQETL